GRKCHGPSIRGDCGKFFKTWKVRQWKHAMYDCRLCGGYGPFPREIGRSSEEKEGERRQDASSRNEESHVRWFRPPRGARQGLQIEDEIAHVLKSLFGS